jgi:hypothetical protein
MKSHSWIAKRSTLEGFLYTTGGRDKWHAISGVMRTVRRLLFMGR